MIARGLETVLRTAARPGELRHAVGVTWTVTKRSGQFQRRETKNGVVELRVPVTPKVVELLDEAENAAGIGREPICVRWSAGRIRRSAREKGNVGVADREGDYV